MPSAKYFRLVVADVKKDLIELSAVHLYNDNERIDQSATLTCGFGPTSGELEPIKSNSPIEGSKVTIDLKTKRKGSCYVVWTFAAPVNVNAFRIGSGTGPETFLDKFSLQWSDDGITFKPFIKILLDKKLFYPGPWQLSDLKPVGRGYPFVMSKADQLIGLGIGGDCSLKDNYSFKGNANNPKAYFQNWAATSVGLNVPLPGIFVSGKYYFEVSCATKNTYANNNAYNKYVLGLFKDPNEKIDEMRDAALLGPSWALNHPAASSSTNPWQFNYANEYSDVVAWKEWGGPGVQHGLAINFDDHTVQVVNPTYAKLEPGVYPMTKSNFATASAIGDKLKLGILTTYGNGCCAANDNVSINFGQEPFKHQPPAGYEPYFGPRWREIPDDFIVRYIKNEQINTNSSGDYNAAGDPIESPYNDLSLSMITEISTGGYYIKGTITREPNAETKRFLTMLFSHESNRVVAQCVASTTGVYEFYGIAYGLYTVMSVDLRTNIVSESIGPVYPKGIV